jgi:probable rRNA maturation factor
MQEHPLIELYVTVGNDQQNKQIEQLLSSVNLDALVQRTLLQVGITQKVMLTLLVTDEAGIRDMNKQYREQDKPTDVLSFPLLEQPLVEAPEDQLWQPQEDAEATPANTPPFVNPPGAILNLGDIVMSWPTLLQQARDAGHSGQYELFYLLCHGVLHLVGYDDHTEAGYQAMVGLQNRILQESGITKA